MRYITTYLDTLKELVKNLTKRMVLVALFLSLAMLSLVELVVDVDSMVLHFYIQAMIVEGDDSHTKNWGDYL